MLSDLLKSQLESFRQLKGNVISDIDGFRQTVENPFSLVLDAENAREHSQSNLAAIGESLNAFGFRKASICVQEETGIVYAGNGVVTWLIHNSIDVCPVLWIPADFSEAQAKAFALADNRSSEMSDWNTEQLQESLDEISDLFDIEDFGFDAEFMSGLGEASPETGLSDPLSQETQTIDYTFSLTPEQAESLRLALSRTEQSTAEASLMTIINEYIDER